MARRILRGDDGVYPRAAHTETATTRENKSTGVRDNEYTDSRKTRDIL